MMTNRNAFDSYEQFRASENLHSGPAEFNLMAHAEVEWVAAADDGEDTLPTFAVVAYTGYPMNVMGWWDPIVVDLSGLSARRATIPMLLNHDRDRIVGQADKVDIGKSKLKLSGLMTGSNESTREVVDQAANGFKWGVSMTSRVLKAEYAEDGQTIEANGRTYKGPVTVARKTELVEVSFVTIPADPKTSAKIAAEAAGSMTGDMTMTFEEWLKKNGFAEATEGQMNLLRASYLEEYPPKKDVEAGDKLPPPSSEQESAPKPDVQAAEQTDGAAILQSSREQAAAEVERIGGIAKACGADYTELQAQAVREGWDVGKTEQAVELATLRAARPAPPVPMIGGEADQPARAAVLEAAALIEGKYDETTMVAEFGEQVVEAASKQFRHGIGLQRLLLEGAWANGCQVRTFNDDREGVLRGAFSTLSLPGILSNVANKFLLAGFMGVEQTWRVITAIRSVKDFKTSTSYRLTGDMEFEEVGADGELHHAEVGEEDFTNQAKTYGKMFSITRQTMINDDMGALTVLPQRIGRGAGLSFNTIFWTAFMNNSSFFTTARLNYASGAGTALSIDALTAAVVLFLNQVDPDSKPLGVAPKILLTPPALHPTAKQLYVSTELRNTTSSTKYPTTNIHANEYTPEYSAYLSNSGITGNSAKAWYLLADPRDLATVEVAFLNGQEQPTVEQADADFNVLGIQFRGYHDFGVSLQEWRAGTKQKGEA